MNTAELVKEAKTEGIEKSIRMERKAGLTEATILNGLIAEYGSDFTKAELTQIMKQTK